MASSLSAVVYSHFSDRFPATMERVEGAADEFVISMPLSRGRARIVCDGGTIFDGDVRPGLLRVLSPGERVTLTRRSPAEAAILTIAGPWFHRRVEEAGYRAPRRSLLAIEPILCPDARVARFAQALSQAPRIDPAQRGLFAEGIAMALLALRFDRSAAGSRPTGGLGDAEFERCVEWADSALGERVDLARWAATLDMAAGEFARRFQRRTGIAPYTWLLNARVDRARLLLAQDDLSLVDVALAVGFSSQSHFTDAFRRRVGAPPGRWRAQTRSSEARPSRST